MRIIPSINTENFEEAKNRINLLKNYTNEFHIDISSKDFANYQTWQNPKEIDRLDEDLKLHLHLMIRLKPQEIIKWDNKRIKIFILHLEACNLPYALIKFAKKLKKEIVLAWSSNIDEEFIEEFVKYVNGILVLGVNPGKSGQKFLESTYERIEKAFSLKSKFKNIKKIILDGGLNEENIKKFIKYPFDYIVVGNAIFGKENPKEAYNSLLNMIKSI